MEFIGYHATNKDNAEKIINYGYTYNPDPTHWLGDGAYFFLDLDLAKWWANQPTLKYGEINTPVIIQSKISCRDERCVDMRNLDQYREIARKFKDFMEFGIKTIEFSKDTVAVPKLRCAFFNWIKKVYEVDIIIAAFARYAGRYLGDINKEIMTYITNDMYLPYPEVQVCVSEKKCVIDSRVIGGDF